MHPEGRQDLQERARDLERQESVERELENAALRRPLYADVEALINPGFLSHKVQMFDCLLCLRSPSPGDLFLIQSRVRQSDPDRVWKEWILATCTWMVDGQSLLETPHAAVRLRKAFQALPPRAIDVFWSVVSGLMNRVSKALGRMEAFCYEHYSRAAWRSCGKQSPVNDRFTGVPGAERLGMNVVQQGWVAFNLSEDERLYDERRWAEAKLIASTQSPRGIKKLNSADDQQRQQEDRRRRRVQDRMYFDLVGWKDKHAELVFQAHTADELVEQMRRWEAGEKDLHDIVVDAWREQVRTGIERSDEERAVAAEERERKRQELEEAAGGDRIVAYSADQVAGLVRKRSRRGPRVFDRTPNRVLYDKYIRPESEVGYMQPGVGAMPVGESPRTLAEQVQERQPSFATESEKYGQERPQEEGMPPSRGVPPMKPPGRGRG